MYLLKKTLFLLLFISSLFLNNPVVALETTSEYIIKTDHIEELKNEFPIIIEDELSRHSIYKILLKDPDMLPQLENDPRITSFSSNDIINVPIIKNPDSFFSILSPDSRWGFQSMNFPETIRSTTTVDVAILDTGIDVDHSLLQSSIRSGYDAISDKSIGDENGHGSHVAGIIAMNTPQFNLIPIKTLDRYGYGDLYSFLRGLYYAIDYNADVINMSFGIRKDNPMIKEAVHKAVSSGIPIVTASGNNGSPYLQFPAGYEEVISVGAYDRNEAKAAFSQYGEHLDYVAPGVDIWSSAITGDYTLKSGTSMATAFITKTVASLKSTNPDLSPAEIEEILTAAAIPLKGETVETVGHGKIDVTKAVKLVEIKSDLYTFFPSYSNVSPMKVWKITMSLPVDDSQFDKSLIRIVNQEGKEIETSIQLDASNPNIIMVSPPSDGYDLGGEYELIIEKGLVAKNGQIGLEEVKMRFIVEK